MKNKIIEIISKPKKVSTEEIKNFLIFSIRHIFGEDLKRIKKLKIKIIFGNQSFLKNIEKNEKIFIYGITLFEDNSYSPKEFQVFIKNNLSKKNTLKTIAHELVHVYQYRIKKLRCLYNFKKTIWENKEFISENTNGNCYNEEPWEKEAFYIEQKIYNEYKKINIKNERRIHIE